MNHIITNLFNQLKQSWKDGRQEIEANGKTVAENEAEAKAYVLRELKNPMNYVETIAIWVAVPYLCRAMHYPKWLTAVLTLGTGEFIAYAKHPQEYKAGWTMLLEKYQETAQIRQETKNLNDLSARLQESSRESLTKKGQIDSLIGISNEQQMQEFRDSIARASDAYLGKTFQ